MKGGLKRRGEVDGPGRERRRTATNGVDVGELGTSKANLTPVNPALYLLANPESRRVLQILEHTPGIVDAALRVRPTPKEAFEYLLAYGIDLTNAEMTALMPINHAEKFNTSTAATQQPT